MLNDVLNILSLRFTITVNSKLKQDKMKIMRLWTLTVIMTKLQAPGDYCH